eukprot:CAMPEP_0206507950 /NCGR_PEP_ID=MMETSP0324_2-20121206/57945_1 /ASSEMBLY_ACC=CAM_ASM_000836 /TAXON_ID=2866 /ORGANISM="Crypthecodinium cohnii, Strain Seligo" /LENGTH=38 /DNA_ID= /DNA_START= /DNA_END= /DNA_ORIENTATION=
MSLSKACTKDQRSDPGTPAYRGRLGVRVCFPECGAPLL